MIGKKKTEIIFILNTPRNSLGNDKNITQSVYFYVKMEEWVLSNIFHDFSGNFDLYDDAFWLSIYFLKQSILHSIAREFMFPDSKKKEKIRK